MRIRKNIFIAAAILAMSVLSLTGCQMGSLDTEQLMQEVSMPEEYIITYEIETATGEIQTVTKGVDADGNIYFKSPDEELLFVKNSDRYTQYELSRETSKEKASSAEYNINHVNNATRQFNECVEKSESKYSGGAERVGDVTVAGVICDEYEINVTVANFTQMYTFAVDKENDICLRWTDTTSIGSYDASEGNESFECTEFITENVVLPADVSDDDIV